jgi:hypothetical protein
LQSTFCLFYRKKKYRERAQNNIITAYVQRLEPSTTLYDINEQLFATNNPKIDDFLKLPYFSAISRRTTGSSIEVLIKNSTEKHLYR